MSSYDDEYKYASSLADTSTLELPPREFPVWDVYTQEDGTAAVCLGGTRTYNQAKEAADSHNA